MPAIRRYIYILLVVNIILLGVAVAVWLLPALGIRPQSVPDSLRHEQRRVYIDTIVNIERQPVLVGQDQSADGRHATSAGSYTAADARNTASADANHTAAASRRREITADISRIARDNPFYPEAAKVLSGKLEEEDAANRKLILNYCEHLRTSYVTRDIDFIRQVMSDKALIIVGHVVRHASSASEVTGDERVVYSLKTKAEYLERLEVVFAANRKIDVRFSNFRIMRHPTLEGIYGVILRQQYASDRYSDDGWLFLLWDFRNRSMPVIHVRTWQPSLTVTDESQLIGINDFNFE